MIETSESIAKLMTAILHVQGAISGVKKDAKNPHFRNSYATLEQVIDTARPALQEAKIAFVQAPGKVIDGALEVTTMLVHEAEWLRSTLHVPLQKHDAQGVGSAITYACRYSLMALLGLPPTDDDGEAAVIRTPTQNTVTGPAIAGTSARTSSAQLKRDGVWKEMMSEIAECETVISLMKCRMAWSKKALNDKWPAAWCESAGEEFDKAQAILEAQTVPDDDVFPGDRKSTYVDSMRAG
jgi:hypothetical protein